jgi:hypothetical protein
LIWCILFRDSDDSKSEDDLEEEQGGVWYPIFNDVISKKEPQQLDLGLFGDEVPPCSAWSNTANDRTRYHAHLVLSRDMSVVLDLGFCV